jgi:hypothetical protein
MVMARDLVSMNHIDRMLAFIKATSTYPHIGNTFYQGDNTPQIFFVDSVSGSNSNDGRDPRFPLAGLDAVFGAGKVLANRGDIVYVMPTHAETVAAAAGIVCDVADVTIIGLGNGTNRPTLTFATSALADINIDAANVSIINFRFIVDVAALAAPIDVNAAGFKMIDCDWYGNNAADEAPAITIITDAAANDMEVGGCSFYYLSTLDATAITATPTELIRLVGADRAKITGNYAEGDFTTSVINGITTPDFGLDISDNKFVNIATENIAGIVDLVAGCRGVIARNTGFHGYVTDIATVIDPSSCAMIENYFSNVVTEAGGIVGTRST